MLMIGRVTQLALSDEIDGIDLQALASKRTTRTETIQAKRGNIYSSDGDILAENVSSYKLIAYLDKKRTTKESDPQHVVDKEKTNESLAMTIDELASLTKIQEVAEQQGLSYNNNNIKTVTED